MKKVYEKPMIMFESFVSSTNIAGDCEVKIDTQSRGLCGIFYAGDIVFLDVEHTKCDWTVEENYVLPVEPGQYGAFDQICYHVPTNYNLFNS